MIARGNRLGRGISAYFSNIVVKGPNGAAAIRATLPDWCSPTEVASKAASALRESGREITTAGQLCEALSSTSPVEKEALRAQGLEEVQVLPAASAVGQGDLGWDDPVS